MKVLMINSVCGIGSTGKICTDIAASLEKEGHEVKIAYGRDGYVPDQFKKYAVRIGTDLDCKVHALETRLFDMHGFGSKRATKKFLKWADSYKPDLLWLHNLHGYYINVELLFKWIKKYPEMEVKWTLHDCWAFTGHCSHFSKVKCNQWKEQCQDCVQLRRYPSCIGISNVKDNFERKRNAFIGVKKMTIITPSQWMANLVKQSFLSKYPILVYYNVVNKEVFKITPGNFKVKYGIQDKFLILGVASVWDDRKGLFDFYHLASMLDNKYVVVMVGLNDIQMKDLPENIIGIPRTNSTTELAEIYTAADVFVNLSVEETFGMTCLEAKECGTPSIVYEDTACAEIAEKFGYTVVSQDVCEVYKAIKNIKAKNK